MQALASCHRRIGCLSIQKIVWALVSILKENRVGFPYIEKVGVYPPLFFM